MKGYWVNYPFYTNTSLLYNYNKNLVKRLWIVIFIGIVYNIPKYKERKRIVILNINKFIKSFNQIIKSIYRTTLPNLDNYGSQYHKDCWWSYTCPIFLMLGRNFFCFDVFIAIVSSLVKTTIINSLQGVMFV